MNRLVRYLMLALAVSWAVPSDAAPLRRRFNRGTTRRPVQEKKQVTPEMQKSLDAGEPMAQPLGWGGGGSGGSGLTVTGTPALGDTLFYDNTKSAGNAYYLQKAGPTFVNVKHYGASGQHLQTTGTGTTGTTALTLASVTGWAEDQGVVIRGGGAAHAIGAPASAPLLGTPVAPTFTVDTTANVVIANGTIGMVPGDVFQVSSTTTLPSGLSAATNYYWSFADTWTYVDATDTITMTTTQAVLQTGDAVKFEGTGTLPTGLTATTTYYVRLDDARSTLTVYDTAPHATDTSQVTGKVTFTGGTGTYYMIGASVSGTTTGQIFTSQANALNNASRVDITSAGSGTHSFAGTTTLTYGVYTITGAGGVSAVGTTTALASQLPRPSASFYVNVCWPTVASNNGFGLTGRGSSNRITTQTVNGATTCYLLTFQAGGYDSFEQADIGTTITQGGSDGIILAYDNTARTCYVLPTVYDADNFPAGAATTTAGSDGGTTTGAAVAAHYLRDTGDATAETVWGNRTFCRRPSDEYRTGDWIIHPFDNTGVWYKCVRTRNTASGTNDYVSKTSSTANASFAPTNTLGVETRDNDVFWRREEPLLPTLEPSAAVPNAFRGTLAALSGTSATLSANLGSSVTAQAVLHDDTTAVQAAHAAMITSGSAATTLYFPPGEYHLVTEHPDATSSRWTEISGTNEYLFLAQSTDNIPRRWVLDGCSLVWQPMATEAQSASGPTDSYQLWELDASNGFTVEGWNNARLSQEPVAEPFLEENVGYNLMYGYHEYTGGTPSYVRNTVFSGLDILNFAVFASESGDRSFGEGTSFYNVYIEHGSSGNDAWAYCDSMTWDHVTYVGTDYLGANAIYNDDLTSNSEPQDITKISDSTLYRGRGLAPLRLRGDSATVTGTSFINCGQIYLETGTRTVLSGLNFRSTNAVSVNGSEVVLSGIALTDTPLLIQGSDVSISGIESTGTTALNSTSSGLVQISGGPGSRISLGGGVVIRNQETSGCTVGLILATNGTTNVTVTGANVTAVGPALTFDGTFNGQASIVGGKYYSGSGPQAFYLSQNASAEVTCVGVTFEANDAGNTLYADNGKVYLKDCTIKVACQFTSGVDGLTMIGNDLPGANASTLDVPNAIYAENVITTAPAASTQTGVKADGNVIAGSKYVSPAELSSGTTNDYGISQVASVIRLNPNASNSTITSIVPRGAGDVITIYCAADAAETLTIDDAAATGTAAYRILLKGGADGTLSNKEYLTIMYDGVLTRWVEIGGSY